jgi:SAM-dependent methyltransferase
MGGFFYPHFALPPVNFSELYLRVREKEGRLYSDDFVTSLPNLPGENILAKEWEVRADSSVRLTRYLANLSRPLNILDLGCGNGWLSGKLSQISDARVWGMDVMSQELTQAARLFRNASLCFLAANIYCAPIKPMSFDVIILASVIQYFPNLPVLISTLQTLLKVRGEIHVLDSPLYLPGQLPSARERSNTYYTKLGFPEMAGYYFHHPISALEQFSPRWLYQPKNLLIRLAHMFGRTVSPFPWIVIDRSS